MKYLPLILTLLAAPTYADSWTTEQKTVEAVYLTAMVLDFNQTLQIAAAEDEANPRLGTSPTDRQVEVYFVKSIAIHWVVADLLPSRWRTKFLYTTAGFQYAYVLHNHWIGYEVRF